MSSPCFHMKTEDCHMSKKGQWKKISVPYFQSSAP